MNTPKSIDIRDETSYKDEFLSILEGYGDIENTRNFDTDIKKNSIKNSIKNFFSWNKRKYPKIITEQSKIDLVDILKKHTGYEFSFFEGDHFLAFPRENTVEEEINYNKNELEKKWFFFDLLHEVWHFPRDWDNEDRVQAEKKAWIKAIQLAKIFKNTYNVCLLAGFENYDEVYNYAKTYIKKYEDEPIE